MLSTLLSIILALNGAAHATAPPVRAINTSAVCPASTADGRRIVANYVSADIYDRARSRSGVPHGSAGAVRALTTDRDADACTRIADALQPPATSGGDRLRDSRLEFYQAGSFYFAVRTVPPSTCKPGPSHACVDTRWQGLHIFDHNLKHVRSLAI